MRQIAPRRLEAAVNTVRRARSRGIAIALGTDAGNPGVWQGANAWELELLVEAGLSPMEALVAATSNAARACALADELGSVQTGKLADCIVVEGDPLQDIHLLRDPQRIKLVIQNGRVVVNRGLSPTAGG
jgi:imidazolonepropionase-like amidohydrolase